jgi:putrescine transport system substrate-binding protein
MMSGITAPQGLPRQVFRSVSQASVSLMLVAALALVAACGKKSAEAPAGNAAPPPAAAGSEKVVNVYNWSDYIDKAVLEKFTAETGIKVNYDVYDGNETLETKLTTGNTGYDVVVPTASFVERQIKANLFRKLDRSKIPNWSNLDPDILARLAQHDPGNQYVVDYMWGTDGIGYDEKKVREIMPDAPVDSWKLVLDPKVASKFKSCGISVLDSPTDVVPVVLAYLGKDPTSESEADLELAMKTLMAVRPYFRMIHSSAYKDGLATGELCIAVGWSGDVYQAQTSAAESPQGPAIRYSIPKEGTIIWFDTLAIPIDAPHVDAAHEFINFLQRPDIAAANSNYLSYANGNAASLALVDDSIKNNPSIYPPPEVKAKLFPDVARPEAYTRVLNRAWTRFVTGQ